MENSVKVVSNFLWRILERFGNQIISFVLSIILARLLEPAVYSDVALVLIFITILNVFIDSGLGSALVQKKEVDDLDFSSVFYFNIIVCIILYIILYYLSPSIASFYHSDELCLVIRVLGVMLIISGIKNIQMSYVSRHLLYKKYFYISLIDTIVSAIVGIWMAFHGYGIWALVFQNLSSNIIDTIMLWILVGWKPKLLFSFSRLIVLLKYGWKLLVSTLLDTIWNKLRQLIIGRKYSPEDLAYYTKGDHYPGIMSSSVMSALNSVLLPTMSKVQDDPDTLKSITRKSIKLSSYVMWPIMIGFFVCADNFVRVLLTDKWMPIVPYLRIFCLTYVFYPIHITNLNAIKSIGRSDVFLILEVLKKIVGVVVVVISMHYGVFAMALSTIFTSFYSQIVNSWPNRKFINYSYLSQLKDIVPSVVLSLLMGVGVYCVNYLPLNNLIILMIQILVGIIIYIGLSYLLKIDNFFICLNMIKKIRKEN